MEFQPLFPAGFFDITLEQLDEFFVLPFENNTRRQYLTERFKIFIEKFLEIGIPSEIWIDGSYSTHKPEPGDIDIVFFYNPVDANILNLEKKALIKELFDRNLSKIRYGCEVFFIPSDNHNLRSYWRGWFGFCREEKPKGIARIIYGIN